MTIQTIEIDLRQKGPPKQARVALAQTMSLDPSKICPDNYLDSVGKAEKGQPLKTQIELVNKQIKRALLDSPDFIVFPELSIPWEMQDELCETAKRDKVFIVGGLTYGPEYQNVCAVFLPFKGEKASIQYKLNRAPAENEHVQTGQRILIFKNSGFGTFASVICYDFTSLSISKEIRDHRVNLLFLPTSNHAVDLFDGMATGQCYTMYSYICLCNSAGSDFGNSASYGPVRAAEGGHLQQERVIGKLAGSQQNTLTMSLDIPGLVESINRFKDNKAVLPDFLTPPADLREPGALVSPYTPLGPARENFVGREQQIREFRACIESSSHVLLLGPSGSGKTSLIHRLRAEMPMEFRTGFAEVYDTEGTFDFFRRLSVEISSRAETEKPSAKFKDTLRTALDNITGTRDAVERYGFDESSKAFIEAFHNLAQTIDTQKIGKIVLFIDQAERLAWLEKDPNKQRYAIRILISIMRDLEALRAPVLFALAIRQHDYDPLIALASNYVPAKIVGLTKFSREDAIMAVEKPLPPEIRIDRSVSSQIADLSTGVPFFVQLLADAAFRKLGQRRVIDSAVFEELNIREQGDVFPLLMSTLTPNEQRFVEAIGICREYTVSMDNIIAQLSIAPDEFRHVADMLLGKNVIESLENDRYRFVHDQMKGFIQREWLPTKMTNLEKLHNETETILQMLLVSPEDNITISFGLPPLVMCYFKSLILDDIENLSRILEVVSSLKHRSAADFCLRVLKGTYWCVSQSVFNDTRSKLALRLEKNGFDYPAAQMLAIEIGLGVTPNPECIQKAMNLIDKLASSKHLEQLRNPFLFALAIDYLQTGAQWANAAGNFSHKDYFLKRIVDYLGESIGKSRESVFHYVVRSHEIARRRSSALRGLYQFAEWVGDLRDSRERNELLKIAVRDFKEESSNEEETLTPFDYAKVANWAEKIGDENLRKELHSKEKELAPRAIDLQIKEAQEYEEEEDYDSAAECYETAAEFAKILDDQKIWKEFYVKAINSLTRAAQEKENKEDYFYATRDFNEAAEFAEKIGDENLRKDLYRKAIASRLRESEKDQTRGDSLGVVHGLAEAASFAEKVSDENLRKDLYGKAISSLMSDAVENQRTGNLLLAATECVDIAEYTRRIRSDANVDPFYEKAAQNLCEVIKTYEKLTTFLLSNQAQNVASALKDYFLKAETELAYFRKISSIVDCCRSYFREAMPRGLTMID